MYDVFIRLKPTAVLDRPRFTKVLNIILARNKNIDGAVPRLAFGLAGVLAVVLAAFPRASCVPTC